MTFEEPEGPGLGSDGRQPHSIEVGGQGENGRALKPRRLEGGRWQSLKDCDGQSEFS